MTVGRICNREVVVAEKSVSLREASRRMRDFHVGSLVIVDREGPQAKPLGILTDRDIVIEVIATDGPLDELTVADVMGAELLTVREEDSLWESLQYMRGRGVRRLPVTNQDGVLVGIVAVDDFLELFSTELMDLTRLIRQEQQHERKVREQP